ncbi:MAG: peroxidase [Myxococcota bacterium]
MSRMPSKPNASLVDLLLDYPEFTRPLHDFAQVLFRGEAPFSAGEREMLFAYASAHNQCDFCRTVHTQVAENLDIEKGLVDDLVADPDLARAPDKLRPVLRFVAKLNRDMTAVGDADVQAIFDAGWDERAFMYATLLACQAAFYNRWVEALGVTAEPSQVAKAAGALAEHGYAGINAMLDDPEVRKQAGY